MYTKEITKIVLAGGPASGKSSVMKRLKQISHKSDINLLFIDEVATVFLRNQPSFLHCEEDKLSLQYYIMRTQQFAEQLLVQNADTSKPTVIISDRGCLDAYVYLNEEEQLLFAEEHLEQFRSRYDHIVYLKGDSDNYFSDKETHRLEEDIETLYKTTERAFQVWSACESFTCIEQQETIDRKVALVVRDIHDYLGREIFQICQQRQSN